MEANDNDGYASSSLVDEDSEVDQLGYWSETNADPCDLDEDVYALAIADLTHDFYRWGVANNPPGVQASRVVADLLLLIGCVGVQIFLMKEIKLFVTAKAVHDIRIAYGAFELWMYGNDTSHCEMTTNGFCRGIPTFFNASLFDTLDPHVQAQACRIPLSQPTFFMIILWIWSTTCMGQLMKLSRQFTSVILRTTTTNDHSAVYQRPPLGPEEEEPEPAEGTQIIYQLSMKMKALFVTLVFLPRFLIVTFLLWLGCRWLLATNNFGDLVLNAVALEFILQLGEVIYFAMAPERNKHDLGKVKLLPLQTKHLVGYQQLAYILGFNAVTMAWVYCYMHYFQMVLPDYRWDVHEVCKIWIQRRFAV